MRKARYDFGVSALVLAAALASPAIAQDASAPAAEPIAPTSPQPQPPAADGAASDQGAQQIVVTGSRIARRDYVADSPIVTVQSSALQNLSAVTLDNALERLPQFTGNQGQAATGSGFGMTGAATLNLRNLGENRNLVLLDGRRLEPSTTNFAVDINIIPSIVIDNVEVITGGASAVYGSDAIAGVTNFKLRRHFDGLEIDAKKGISDHGEFDTTDVSLLGGVNFADDRGNAMIALSYTKRGATFQNDLPFYKRAFQAGSGSFALGFLDVGYYQPELDTHPAGPANIPNWPGFPFAGPVEYGFNTDHTSIFNVSTGAGYNSGVYPQNPLYAINNGVKFNANYNEYATTPLERYSGFGRFEYKVTDNVTAYAQFLYSHYDVKNAFIPLPASNSWAVAVPRDAAHPVPAALAAMLNARPVPGLPWHLGRSLSFIGQPITNNSNDVYQATVGLSGSLAGNNWTWDINASHGDTRVDSTGDQGYALWTRYNELIQAPNYGAGFTGGTTSGSCTSGISPFIDQSAITQDCIDYLSYRYVNQIRQKQDIAEANLQGKLADLPGGELRVALGADYRRNSLRSDVDPEFRSYLPLDPATGAISNIVSNFSANSSAGSSSVWELYGEVLVPIIKDVPLIQSFDVDLAYRYSDYRLSGGVSTYKGDANWEVTDFLRLRGGYQRAVRAPNVTELFSSSQSNIVIGAQDPCVNAGPFATPSGPYGNNAANPDVAKVRALCTAITPNPNPGLYNSYTGSGTPVLIGQYSGNPDLAPERANTYTAGLILTPKGLPWNSRFSASLDYYNISVKGAIAALDANQNYQLCFNAFGTNPNYDPNDPYCKVLLRLTGNGLPQGTAARFQNQGGIKTQGVDAQIDWVLPIGSDTLDLNEVATYLIKYKISFAPGVAFIDYADTISSNDAYFRWRSLTTATYRTGPVSAGVRWKHLPSIRDFTCTSTCTAPKTSHYDSVDLFASFDVGDKYRFSIGADNVFDKQPPVVGGVLGNTNVAEYDVVGRQFYASVRAKF